MITRLLLLSLAVLGVVMLARLGMNFRDYQAAARSEKARIEVEIDGLGKRLAAGQESQGKLGEMKAKMEVLEARLSELKTKIPEPRAREEVVRDLIVMGSELKIDLGKIDSNVGEEKFPTHTVVRFAVNGKTKFSQMIRLLDKIENSPKMYRNLGMEISVSGGDLKDPLLQFNLMVGSLFRLPVDLVGTSLSTSVEVSP